MAEIPSSTGPADQEPRLGKRARAALLGAFQAAATAFGPLPLPFDLFVEGVLRRAVRRLRRAGIPTTSPHLARLLSLMPCADLYLAIACDRSVPGAWECFERHCLSRLRPILLLHGIPALAAADLLQELPGDLFASPATAPRTLLSTYDGSGSLLAWLATIALRKHARRHRRHQPMPLDLVPEDLLLEASAKAFPADPLQESAAAEGANRFEAIFLSAWERFTERERQVLALSFGGELKLKETAARLRIGEPRACRLRENALRKLRERLQVHLGPGAWPETAREWARIHETLGRLLGLNP